VRGVLGFSNELLVHFDRDTNGLDTEVRQELGDGRPFRNVPRLAVDEHGHERVDSGRVARCQRALPSAFTTPEPALYS
jgi:hypothetical protein